MTFFRIVSDLKFPNPIFRIQLGSFSFLSRLIDFLKIPVKKRIIWTDFLQIGGEFFETTNFETALYHKQRLSELNNYPQISFQTSFKEIDIRNTFYEIIPSDY